MPSTTRNNNRYSLWVGLVFIFNIIIGTGALTLPAAFAKAGWLLGTAAILFLAFVSFINATYVIECMACANAVIRWRSEEPAALDSSVQVNRDSDESSDDEQTPIRSRERWQETGSATEQGQDSLLPPSSRSRFFVLDRRVELGEMATMFFSPLGRLAFYVTIVVYLFGDLSIYSAAIAKSTMDVICTNVGDNTKLSSNLHGDLPCFNGTGVADDAPVFTRIKCYRMALLTFFFAAGPFVFFNVQKTKHLQIFTTVMRWLAFITMISLAIRLLLTEGPKGNPPISDMSGIPALFGACVYSFMCHHSLPGMIAPIKTNKSIASYLSIDFIVIGIFYLLLALTGIFAFAHPEDLYTLNFMQWTTEDQGVFLKVVEYFLGLFPVLTLSTSFPVVAITLRNNIQNMFLDMSRLSSYNVFWRRLLFPVVTIVPPMLLTLFFEDITVLVSFTGSYAGTGVQYLIPTFLVVAARKQCELIFGPHIKNPYISPFRHVFWAIFILVWSCLCVILVSLHFLQRNNP